MSVHHHTRHPPRSPRSTHCPFHACAYCFSRQLASLLPARPAATEDPSRADIINEALDLFRANALFRNFEIQGPADRLLIYLILFIGDVLTKIATGQSSLQQPYHTPTRPRAVRSARARSGRRAR